MKHDIIVFLNGNLVKHVIHFHKDLKYLKSFVEIHHPVSAKGRCFYPTLGLSKILVTGTIEKQKTWQRNTQLQRECSNRLWMKTGTVIGSENPWKWTCSIYKLGLLYRHCIKSLWSNKTAQNLCDLKYVMLFRDRLCEAYRFC